MAQEKLRFGSVAAFDAWYEGQEGRWELHDGEAVAMSPERVAHTRMKQRVWRELERALLAAGSACEALGDGPMVPGPGLRRFQPDVLVACERPGGKDVVVERPIILVEVLSPSTQHIDVSLKLESYFALPSVEHYLVVSPLEAIVVHHRRLEGASLLTRICRSGVIELAPPGIGIAVGALYEGMSLEG